MSPALLGCGDGAWPSPQCADGRLLLCRAGGTSVRTFLEKTGSFQKQEELQLRLCGLGKPTMLNAYFCYGQVGGKPPLDWFSPTVMPESIYTTASIYIWCPQKAPPNEARNASCSKQQTFLDGAARERSFYEAAGCNLAAGHYDSRCAGSQRGLRRTVGARGWAAGRQGSEAAQVPSGCPDPQRPPHSCLPAGGVGRRYQTPRDPTTPAAESSTRSPGA